MHPFPHYYEVQLEGGFEGHGVASASGLTPLPVAAPVEFGGPGGVWTPEHLFLAAIEACFLLTFRAVARASLLEFVALEVHVTGVVDREARTTRFTGIVLRPRLTVPSGTDRDRALNALRKAEAACLVSASIATPIRLVPEVVESPAPVKRVA